MERIFKSKEDMYFNLVDDDGFLLEEDAFLVPKDSIWYWDDEDNEKDSKPIYLISEDLKQWLEVEYDVVEKGFEEVIHDYE